MVEFVTIKEYNCYILRSLKNRKLYIGSTPDLKARLRSHNLGENKATKPNIPYEVIFYSGFINKEDAIKNELYYKTTAGWKRVHNMLENTLQKAKLKVEADLIKEAFDGGLNKIYPPASSAQALLNLANLAEKLPSHPDDTVDVSEDTAKYAFRENAE